MSALPRHADHRFPGGLTNVGGPADADFWLATGEPSTTIESRKDQPPGEAALAEAASTRAAWSSHLREALAFVSSTMAAQPALFGLAAQDTCNQPPVWSPELIVRRDGQWEIRFAEGRLPICDPYGLLVVFANGTPIRIEDLSASEPDS